MVERRNALPATPELRTFTLPLEQWAKLKREHPDILTEDTDNLLYIHGDVFDAEDLTYGEKREIRRIIRHEIWDEDMDGPYNEDRIGENEALPATILVFMRRSRPDATIDDAMAIKPREAYRAPSSNGNGKVTVPPTSREPAGRATRAKSGSQT
jgi:hypothetical protein